MFFFSLPLLLGIVGKGKRKFELKNFMGNYHESFSTLENKMKMIFFFSYENVRNVRV